MSAPQYAEFDNFSLDVNICKYSLMLLFLNIAIATDFPVGDFNNVWEHIPSISQPLTMVMMLAVPVLLMMMMKRLLKDILFMTVPTGSLFQYY